MITPLLQTKLFIPSLRPNLVPRPRLVRRLNEGLCLGHRMSLICAPAGFGKTTLILEWLQSLEKETLSHLDHADVVWFSIDDVDNDPVQFLTYLIAAFQQTYSSIGQTAQRLLHAPQTPPVHSLVTLLINDLVAAGKPLLLVLDDYQLITASAVHQVVQFFLDNQPPCVHLVVGTREVPPLPLPRLRARGQLTEIQEQDLRFTAEEASSFLNQAMRLRLSDRAVDALQARTEGWIAGLQLAALALQEEYDDRKTAAFITNFTGDDRYVMDYLITEVLQQQSEVTRAFLRQTSVLERLTGSLCNAVTGREDSRVVLEQLDEANLFVMRLDHRREWYRYHRLFAEALRTTLEPSERLILDQRALQWYEAQGMSSQAIHHALSCAKLSGDFGAAARLIAAASETMLYDGGVVTVSNWLDLLPGACVRDNVKLAICKAWALMLTGESELAEVYVDAADARLARGTEIPESSLNADKLTVLRSLIALSRRRYGDAATLAAGALQGLQHLHPHWRVLGLWAMAEAQERTGNLTEAIAMFLEARQTGRMAGNLLFTVLTELSLAKALNDQARWQEAMTICEESIAWCTDEEGRMSPLAGAVFNRMGVLYYEVNDLGRARSYHEQGLALSAQSGLDFYATLAQVLMAPMYYAQGEQSRALEILKGAHGLVTREGLAEGDWFLSLEADLHLRSGDLAFAVHWAEQAPLLPDVAEAVQDASWQSGHVEKYLTYVRVLLAQRRLDDARRWLEQLARLARVGCLDRWMITISVLQALVSEAMGNVAAAHDALSRAVQLAASGPYVRAFLDEDARVVSMLPAVRHVAPAFVDQILAYRGRVSVDKQARLLQALVEPLSGRELEVLRLLADGLKNKEIAQRLFIAVGTVKQHLKNIYSKLDVHNRTEAANRARDLKLL